MTIGLLNNSSIESISTISCGEVSLIQAIPNILARNGIVLDGQEADEILGLNDKLKSLQYSLDNYNPSLIKRIVDFICSIFTGKFCIVWRLSRSLSEVILAVNAAAQRILQHRAEQAQPDVEPESPVTVPPPLPVPVTLPPAATNLPDIEVIPADVFAAKKKLVGRVVDLTKTDAHKYPLANINKIRRFFEELNKRLNNDKDAQIPLYFHATKDNFIGNILKDKKLEMKPGTMGFGVFVSTINETTNYGPYTFVFDGFLLSKVKANHDYTQTFRKMQRTWICLKDNISITPKTLSCMVTDDFQGLSKVLSAHGLNPRSLEEHDDKELVDNDVPIFTIAEGDAITQLVQAADPNPKFPANWHHASSFDAPIP